MSVLEHIRRRARGQRRTIALPEAEDPRILAAAARAVADELADILLIGEAAGIARAADAAGVDLAGVEIVDPATHPAVHELGERLYELRRHKGMTRPQAEIEIHRPLNLAAMLVAAGQAQGCVAGAATATAEVVRAALQLVGMRPGGKLVSSFFIMEHPPDHPALPGASVFADCALVIEPDAEQLAHIAVTTADSAREMAGLDPLVALLSFSTAGSARHPLVDKVIRAGELIAQMRPDLRVIPEVQFDAAVAPEVLRHKAPDAPFQAPANVFIFPDLQSANIGYKIAQRLAGTRAVGPVLQGLNFPVNDLSRGCSVDDVVQLVAITAAQVNAQANAQVNAQADAQATTH